MTGAPRQPLPGCEARDQGPYASQAMCPTLHMFQVNLFSVERHVTKGHVFQINLFWVDSMLIKSKPDVFKVLEFKRIKSSLTNKHTAPV